MPTTVITLTPPAKFINANDRLHHMVKAKLTKAWRDAAYMAVLGIPLRDRPHDMHPAHITVAYRFPNNRRRETSNLQPTSKAIVDGLVDAGVVPDDSDQYVVGPDNRRHIPNGTPLVTITIRPLEDS